MKKIHPDNYFIDQLDNTIMNTLQEKSFAAFFEQIINNPTMDTIVKKHILEYLKNNKEIVSDFIVSEGIYNVYMRQQDVHSVPNMKSSDIHLVASFGTYREAEDWTIKNGHDIVESEEDNYGKPIILTIIHQKNDQIDLDFCHEQTNSNLISANCYPSFAFSEKGYLMLLDEHKDIVTSDWCHEVIPNWIYWIQQDGIIFRGYTEEYFLKLHKRITYVHDNESKKKRELEEFYKFFAEHNNTFDHDKN